MITRAVTGAIYVTVIVLSVYLGGFVLMGVMGVITFLLLWEYAGMFSKTEYTPDKFRIAILGLLVYVASIPALMAVFNPSMYRDIFIFLGTVGVAFLVIGIFELFRGSKNPLWNVLIGISAIIYVLPAMILINGFALFNPYEHMVFPLLGIFILIWTFDTFAYLVGRKLGKTKLAPSISPNKSWEGFFGGVLGTVLVSMLISYFLENEPYLSYLALALIVCVFATLGDLFESMIKRNLNLKDSGKMMPGHGGILDRFDSVLFVIPVAYCFFIFLIKIYGE